jgi:hypothetical protein
MVMALRPAGHRKGFGVVNKDRVFIRNNIAVYGKRENNRTVYYAILPDEGKTRVFFPAQSTKESYEKAVRYCVNNTDFAKRAPSDRQGRDSVQIWLTYSQMKFILELVPDIPMQKFLREKLKRKIKISEERMLKAKEERDG